MINKVIAVYPGRFQPMGRHHKATYDWMVSNFGPGNSFIVTSDKVSLPDSPFGFEEKAKIAQAYGIPAEAIKNERVVYAPTRYGFLSGENPMTTAVVVVVGQKDLQDSFDPKSGKVEKARFKPGVTLDGIKRNGQPTYFKSYIPNTPLQGFDVHGYVVQAPHQAVDIAGAEMSGSALRSYLPQASDEEFAAAMGFDDPEVRDIIRSRLMTESFERAEKGTQEYSTYLEKVMDELKYIKSTYESRKKSTARYRKEASKIQDAYSELRKLLKKNNKLLHSDENEPFDRKALKEWFKKDYNKSLITENVEHYKKLIPMLNSKDPAQIKQACELGETLGYFKVYDVREHRAAIEWSLLFPYEELQPFLDACAELGVDTDDNLFKQSGVVYIHPFVTVRSPKKDPRFDRYRVK